MMEDYWKQKIRSLPHSPGVYLMRDAGGKIIYVGKAINLKKRIASYFRADVEPKTVAIIHSLRHIDYILAASEREALILERQLINQFQPYFNAMWRDDKSYPYIRFSKKEDFPTLTLTRKIVKDGSEYFGPYPHVFYVKKLLGWLQRFFKFKPCRLPLSEKELPKPDKVRSCLYYHTNRCTAPCLGKITSKEYKEKMKGIALFLKGKYGRLQKQWEREMATASKNLDYEKAAELRDRLYAIKTMEERVTIRELKTEDLPRSLAFTARLEELKKTLGLLRWPILIEGFDISDISGTEAVGSMVRFQNAQPDKDNYRKFKIKTVSGIDDFSMMKEVVYRRYRHLKQEKGEFPDLILVDGGKGQLNSAREALSSLKVKVPIVSLAKKEEDIFVPGRAEPLKLGKDSPALQLLQLVRDEAHRFAISYHHLRRRKSVGL